MVAAIVNLTVAALSWDPQIRGFLIVVTAFAILVGSVYLLLATNLGTKVGFLIAAAGLTGWLAVMGWIWVAYGIGIKGPTPHWEVEDVLTGDVRALSDLEAANTFPQGWERMEEGNPLLGDAAATAEHVLIPQTGGGHEAGAEEPSPFEPIFEDTDEYTLVGGYRTGGEDYFIPGGFLERNDSPFPGWLHQTHYAVIQVQPVIAQPEVDGAFALGGAPPTPVADPAQPTTSVVMVRNLGALRWDNIKFSSAFSILFLVICYTLHRRDKEIMALRAATATG